MKKNMVVLQDKIAEVNNNGTSEIAPDNGYDGLGKVALTVNVAGGGDMSKYALKTDVEAETAARTEADAVLQLNIDTKQDTLVSGANIVTINGIDILQAGNLEVQGTPGPQGERGPQGIPGPQGEPGRDGFDGVDGERGPEGPQGLQGPAGERGPQGEKGKDGAGVNIIDDLPSETALPEEGKTGDAYLVNGELWVWVGTGGDSTNGKFKNVGNIKGPKGDTGAQGPAGERGPQGEPGAKGDTGEKGTDGKDGAIGPIGETGPAGADGADGITPHIGENGNWYIGAEDTGLPSRGIQGEKGADGAKGDTGAVGPQGPIGETGPAGADGKDGVTPDMSIYQTTEQADAKYLQSVPAEYVTDTELTEKGYLTAVPEGYATTAYVDEKIGQIDNVLKTI